MIDEMGSRLWVEHHNAFARDMQRLAAGLRAGIGRFFTWDGSLAHLAALALSAAITALTFNGTAA
jgi:hypothetical protein